MPEPSMADSWVKTVTAMGRVLELVTSTTARQMPTAAAHKDAHMQARCHQSNANHESHTGLLGQQAWAQNVH